MSYLKIIRIITPFILIIATVGTLGVISENHYDSVLLFVILLAICAKLFFDALEK